MAALAEETGPLVERRIQRLSGMHDIVGRAHEQRTAAIQKLRDLAGGLGYTPIDTPLLEETELFVRKSGGELTSSLYTFTDPGGYRVSLRPEFTSAAIRHLIEGWGTWSQPARLQYAGPVFRYQPGDAAGYRQFTQFGIELVGGGGVSADGEVLHLAWEGLHALGVDARLTIGHIGALYRLLGAFDLSDRARVFIVSNIAGLRDGVAGPDTLVRQAAEAGMLEIDGDGRGDAPARTLAGGVSADAARDFVEGILGESMPGPLGRRTSEQIVARLVGKLSGADSPSVFGEGLSLIRELVRLRGSPEHVLDRARRIASDHGAPAGELDELAGVVEACLSRGVPDALVHLDLGLARGISYYTGVVFTLSYALEDGAALLGSGGRYDGLVRALGGPEDVPALGYAYNLEEVVALQSRLAAVTQP